MVVTAISAMELPRCWTRLPRRRIVAAEVGDMALGGEEGARERAGSAVCLTEALTPLRA